MPRIKQARSFGVAVLFLVLATPIPFRLVFLHALSLRNKSPDPVVIDCGRFASSVTLGPDETGHIHYGIVGSSFTCVVTSSKSSTSCGRSLRVLEDVYLTLAADGTLDCDDY